MSNPAKTFPIWGLFSLVTNSILMLAVILLIWQQQRLTAFFGTTASSNQVSLKSSAPAATPELGKRHQLNYQQWLDILKQEAKVAADDPPRHLTILAGDSLSLWFPSKLLPEDRNWLNQAISGETSNGLLQRLNLFDSTQPEVILVMIGINDLIRGVSDEVILDDQRRIITYLRKMHPQARIVIQSILPHGGEEATWEGRAKLLAIPNSRIRQLNQQLQSIATKKNVTYLDLHSLFTNQEGSLRREFTTDGLHLSPQGYIVWRTALQIYGQTEFNSSLRKSERG
ncbi:SGNH/GDSL hydrolase family protein [Cylindrospermum sp. FACHB-282]|uniref:SGNH/GDSL hydrolase family protein n=1 Tax=Cylindrospermum sp. FACHB-282 TaxID=2692794 RepID=UPI0016828132|nr:SGNH/GDSL hydrolase family protein [Cylindrospermum sp. FACHB-282]MBD2387024.1 G-D-S-L family lipolytic protein [Cylindrospermum sp. FACHB-282]